MLSKFLFVPPPSRHSDSAETVVMCREQSEDQALRRRTELSFPGPIIF